MGRGLPLRRCSLRVPQLLNADPAPRLGLRAGTHTVNGASVDVNSGSSAKAPQSRACPAQRAAYNPRADPLEALDRARRTRSPCPCQTPASSRARRRASSKPCSRRRRLMAATGLRQRHGSDARADVVAARGTGPSTPRPTLARFARRSRRGRSPPNGRRPASRRCARARCALQRRRPSSKHRWRGWRVPAAARYGPLQGIRSSQPRCARL